MSSASRALRTNPAGRIASGAFLRQRLCHNSSSQLLCPQSRLGLLLPFLSTSASTTATATTTTRHHPASIFSRATAAAAASFSSSSVSPSLNARAAGAGATAPPNPYRAKRRWPPDVSKLSEKQQFRLERKYRRRAKLKYARPQFVKWTKLVQWAAIGGTLIYGLFFLELDQQGDNPFEGLRESTRAFFRQLFSLPQPSQPRREQSS